MAERIGAGGYGKDRVVTSRTFLLSAVGSVLVAATCLVLADALDSPALALIGCASVGVAFAARESWQWRGQGRQWLIMTSALATVVVVAFVASVLAR